MKRKNIKRHRLPGLFDEHIRLSKISKLGDPLEKISKGIDFELFRPLLENKLESKTKGKGGRPRYDYILMFKILILQRYFNLSDDQMEFQINDRLSFMRFLNLSIADDIPDSKTIWHFKEKLTEYKLIDELFECFIYELSELGIIAKEGKMIDASFVDVPRQRNSAEQNEQIKEGKRPEEFDENQNVGGQKDTEARWAKKNNEVHFGYKDHICADTVTKLILKFFVTSANVHDSQVVDKLISKDDKSQKLYADAGYTGKEILNKLKEMEVEPQICEKGNRGRELTDEQKENNRKISKTRARVEHIFGFMEGSMKGMHIKTIGIARAKTTIGLMNLTYNLFRFVEILKQNRTSAIA